MKKLNLTNRERVIIAVLISKMRSMTSQQVRDELEKQGTEISRPTVAKDLESLKRRKIVKTLGRRYRLINYQEAIKLVEEGAD